MRYESGTKYIFLNLQMLVKCCVLEAITKYCGSGVELRMINVSKTSNHCESPNTQWERQIIIPPVHLLVWLY